MTAPTFGSIVYSFFLDYLPEQKGLRPSSIHSYRDTMRLFLNFAAGQCRRGVSELRFEELGFERVLAFLRDMEQTRHNAIATRNQRLAGLHTFYEYVGRRMPEMLHVCAQVAAIPVKRCALPETRFMAREEVETLTKAADRFKAMGENGGSVGGQASRFKSAQRKFERKHFRDRMALLHHEKERTKIQREMGQDPYLDTAE